MIKKLREYILEPYYRHPFIEQKQAQALFFYILMGIPVIFIILLLVAFFSPENFMAVFPVIIFMSVVALISLFMLRRGLYEIAANTITISILVSLLGGLAIWVKTNPLLVFSSDFYLLLVVIIQASLFCSRKWVIFYSLTILIANFAFYIAVFYTTDPANHGNITLSVIFITLAVSLITILTQLSTGIFTSAMSKLENELKVNVEQFLTIQDLHDSSEKLQHDYDTVKEVSLKDALTGLKNRRFLNEIIFDEINIFLSQKTSIIRSGINKRSRILGVYGIFIADIDHFKKVNDTYGHDSGDMVLQQLSELLLHSIRKDDIAIRYGGEEFLIILKNSTAEFLPEFAEKLRTAIEAFDFKLQNGLVLRQTCSIGFCGLPFDENNPDSIGMNDCISLADGALYYSKNNGRNRWTGIEKGLFELRSEQIKEVCSSLENSCREGVIRLRTGRAGQEEYIET